MAQATSKIQSIKLKMHELRQQLEQAELAYEAERLRLIQSVKYTKIKDRHFRLDFEGRHWLVITPEYHNGKPSLVYPVDSKGKRLQSKPLKQPLTSIHAMRFEIAQKISDFWLT